MLIPKNIFAISHIIPNQPVTMRYELASVRLKRTEDNQCSAAATDGHRLIIATWDDTHARADYPSSAGKTEPKPGFEALIPKKSWEAISKLIPKKNTIKEVLQHCLVDEVTATETERVPLITTNLETTQRSDIVPSKSRFPSIEECIPKYIIRDKSGTQPQDDENAAVYIGINPKMLAELLLTIAMMTDNNPVTIVVPTKPDKPIVIYGSERSKCTVLGLQMPVLSIKPPPECIRKKSSTEGDKDTR